MKLLLLLLLILLPSSSIGSVIKPPYVSAFSNVAASLRSYCAAHDGHLPRDMDEFVSSGGLSGEVRESARQCLDFERRYRFFTPPVGIESHGEKEEIVLIGRMTGREGEGTEQDHAGKIVSTPGRLMVVRTAKGELQSRRYSEERLKYQFMAAGLDLAAYTSDCGPLPGYMTRQASRTMWLLIIGATAVVAAMAFFSRKKRLQQ